MLAAVPLVLSLPACGYLFYTDAKTDVSASVEKQAGGFKMEDYYLYYTDAETGEYVKNTTIQGFQFDENGRYTTGDASLDSALHDVVAEHCTSEAASEENLRIIYDFAVETFQYQPRKHVEAGAEGWDLEFAVPMMQSYYGNCYSWTAAFTYLARYLGFEAYSISGYMGSEKRDHSWTEIIIDGEPYVFDPELEVSHHGTEHFFKLSYENNIEEYHKAGE